MTDVNLPDDKNHSDAAGEYVLDTLSIDERVAFEAALEQDRTLLAQVEEWKHLLAPILESAPEVAPTDAVWQRLEASLRPNTTANIPVAPTEETSVVNLDNFRQSRNRWRGFSVGLMSLAAGLTAFVMVDGSLLQPPSIVPDRLAVLTRQGGGVQFVATVDPAREGIHIRPLIVSGVDPFADGPLVLWVKLDDKNIRLGEVNAAKWQWLDYSKALETEAFTNASLLLAKAHTDGSEAVGEIVFEGRVSSKAR
ncbi:MAG: hypothetical protein ABJO09_11760 [Hyphomicrobiales bacterium]